MSKKYILFGGVTPERALIELGSSILFKIDHAQSELKGDLSVSIHKNQIIADFTTSENISNWNTLKNIISENIATIVDYVGVNHVVGYSIDIRAMYDVQDAKEHVFGVSEPLSGITIGDKEVRQINITEEMLKISYLPHIQFALNDFKFAILCPKDTGLFCYRAFESLINFTMEKEQIKDKKTAITKIVEIANMDKSCLDFLRQLNINVRHGKPEWISGESRAKAIQIARELILRFIAYLNNNKPPVFEYYTIP